MMKKHDSCYFFCGDNNSYVHVGLYILVELPLLATFVGGSESSMVRKFQGAKVPHLELSLPGANGLGSEKSIIPQGACRTNYGGRRRLPPDVGRTNYRPTGST